MTNRNLVCAAFLLLLVVVPVADFAWTEPGLDGSHGVWCQLHANPGLAVEPESVFVERSAILPVPDCPAHYVPLLGSSIFVPPRA